MPNIAAQFGESATCISFNENNQSQAPGCYCFVSGLRYCPVIDEKLMDAATVLAASGTAFALRYTEHNEGHRNRFDWKTALAISAQTAGAAEMSEASASEQLIDSDHS
jgi:pyrroline-5-carboxylate reductase